MLAGNSCSGTRRVEEACAEVSTRGVHDGFKITRVYCFICLLVFPRCRAFFAKRRTRPAYPGIEGRSVDDQNRANAPQG